MRSNVMRLAMAVVAVAIAAVLFVVLQDAGDESNDSVSQVADTQDGQRRQERKPSEPAIPKVVVRDGKPVGGVAELTFNSGQRIRFRVSSDVGDEVHVHGYDISKDVEPGGSINFDFPADLEGIFEIELEHRAEPILELQVYP